MLFYEHLLDTTVSHYTDIQLFEMVEDWSAALNHIMIIKLILI